MTPLWKSFDQDAILMRLRAELERAWRDDLTEENRQEWRDAWAIENPRDAYGREYIATPRTSLDQWQVPEQTVYAWSQCFAAHRFGSPVCMSPDLTYRPQVTIGTLTAEEGALVIRDITNEDAPPISRWIIYATPPLDTVNRKQLHRMRFVATIETGTPPATIDITGDYAPHAQLIPGSTIAVMILPLRPDGLALPASNIMAQVVS